jgi:serine/threonine-protein kinase
MGEAPAPAVIPTERRTGQVILGALLVVMTAALVARTALRSGDPGLDPAQAAPPVPTATAHTVRPRVAPLPPRTARPRLEASAAPVASAEARPASTADAGVVAAITTAEPTTPRIQPVSSATTAPSMPSTPPGATSAAP